MNDGRKKSRKVKLRKEKSKDIRCIGKFETDNTQEKKKRQKIQKDRIKRRKGIRAKEEAQMTREKERRGKTE